MIIAIIKGHKYVYIIIYCTHIHTSQCVQTTRLYVASEHATNMHVWINLNLHHVAPLRGALGTCVLSSFGPGVVLRYRAEDDVHEAQRCPWRPWWSIDGPRLEEWVCKERGLVNVSKCPNKNGDFGWFWTSPKHIFVGDYIPIFVGWCLSWTFRNEEWQRSELWWDNEEIGDIAARYIWDVPDMLYT